LRIPRLTKIHPPGELSVPLRNIAESYRLDLSIKETEYKVSEEDLQYIIVFQIKMQDKRYFDELDVFLKFLRISEENILQKKIQTHRRPKVTPTCQSPVWITGCGPCITSYSPCVICPTTGYGKQRHADCSKPYILTIQFVSPLPVEGRSVKERK
jgi:hypothetical protein